MDEIRMLGPLTVLLLMAIGIVVYALRKTQKFKWLIALMFSLFVLSFYVYFGGVKALMQYRTESRQKALVQEMLLQVKSPESLVIQLKERLKKEPNSAKGWYLLGRLQMSLGKTNEAIAAFQKAYQLNPSDEKIAINYIQARWEKQGRQLTPELKTMIQQILNQNPNQPDAIAMLALNAFHEAQYDEAIRLWERLLKQVPVDSEDGVAITEAIAKAEMMKKKQGSPLQ